MVSQVSGVYDGIILGAGHNSLVLQAYLGKAGLRVLCLEPRDVAGGGLTTMEDPRHPGFFHNTHSFFHRGLNRMPGTGIWNSSGMGPCTSNLNLT